jgi:ribonuclease R
MIAANETVATHIYNMSLPFIYRIHGTPKEEKIRDFINLLKIININVNTNNINSSSKSMQRLLDNLKKYKEFPILSKLLLRSMQKAVYSDVNIGHFGLGLRTYTHFTSPIRRYCDLQIHRIIKLYLKGKMKERNVEYYKERLENVALKINITDKSAVEVMRESVKYEMAYYMEDHIGEEYDAVITSFVGPGIYVLINNAIDVMIPENGKHRLKIDNNGYTATHTWFDKRICVGDKVRVKITNADRMRRIIDAEFVRCDDVKG